MEPLEWLTDNCSAYRAHETWACACMLGLEPCWGLKLSGTKTYYKGFPEKLMSV